MVPGLTEAAFQAGVVELAGLTGWEYWHDAPNTPRVSKRGRRFVQNVVPGFPDLVLIRPPELLVVELKRDGQYPTAAQRKWLGMFAECGVETYVWRPRDWAAIEARLARPRLAAAA